ncbi:Hsp20 family protein [Blochmannia endosymbiont of Camponotus sp. C-003]|uniref:Hsp20 family protein n=1 Tax=unclassified Candidatus Blochmanniella TaxID=711328 RepID=UPI0020255E82|nr:MULTISPECIES: Hsp20 family protein [unclassified Candidatus Blochmannia]URJ23208.1 Hsp20 family protein [Blochmannia endosymbiont of Camponotus sp. C-003]URJ28677.1 Hsp20 family protein [Blochmannia endosymbiont of Camponotus sp. C-046]
MRNFDFSPLYGSVIGFDRLVNFLEIGQSNGSYPPYNVELVSEHKYCISIVVAGFTNSELDITMHDNMLVVKGIHIDSHQNSKNYLYQGITEHDFERKFQLAEHIQITGANLEYGILYIHLERILPDTLKPRRIEIK